ncbi:uncharacterized protein EI97DRAFT_498756 [Westerdykella ornata]|uniref:Uncharacterized protein n=1 Tax=Westerdykella ornata TaxID=318751 RepID=A0A6A6JRI7_WESOR|nr:uncharacterized protein EI97DRAFT_498756 [Westerdykella ornata]KAF2279240.1 hypothetical protein EI97DRAFT_498756 [Westerdykella ornata]
MACHRSCLIAMGMFAPPHSDPFSAYYRSKSRAGTADAAVPPSDSPIPLTAHHPTPSYQPLKPRDLMVDNRQRSAGWPSWGRAGPTLLTVYKAQSAALCWRPLHHQYSVPHRSLEQRRARKMNPNIFPLVRKPVGYGPPVLERRSYGYGGLYNLGHRPQAWTSDYAAASATAKRRCDRQRRQFGRSHRWGTPFGAYRQRAVPPPLGYPRTSRFGHRYPYPYAVWPSRPMGIPFMPMYRPTPCSRYASTLPRAGIAPLRGYPTRRYRSPPFHSYPKRHAYPTPPVDDDDDVFADEDDDWGDSDDEDDLYDSSWDYDTAEDDDLFDDRNTSYPFSSCDSYSLMYSDYADDDCFGTRNRCFHGHYGYEHPHYPYSRR